MYHFTTHFDATYLERGLALYRSLVRHCGERFRLYVLALDDETYQVLTQPAPLPGMHVAPLAFVESADLKRVRADRTWQEYCWTLTPALVQMMLLRHAPDHLVYVDADSYLFDDPAPYYDELARHGAELAIVPHRFPEELAWRSQKNGVYNVNWVYFANTPAVVAVLKEWRAECLASCCAKGLPFADQSYLDDWPARHGAHVVQHLGVNLAPWNQAQWWYELDVYRQVPKFYVIDGDPRIDQGVGTVRRIDPLLLYHFHEHALDVHGQVQRGGYVLRSEVIRHVYHPYEDELRAVREWLVERRRGAGAADAGRAPAPAA